MWILLRNDERLLWGKMKRKGVSLREMGKGPSYPWAKLSDGSGVSGAFYGQSTIIWMGDRGDKGAVA